MKRLKPILLILILCTFVGLLPTNRALSEDIVIVSIDVQEDIHEGSVFTTFINIADVTGLDSGQLELSFNPDVIEITEPTTDIRKGSLLPEGSYISANLPNTNTVRVVFNIPGAGPNTGVTGSGTLIEIEFKVIGSTGESSKLDLTSQSDFNSIYDNLAQPILANWQDAMVEVHNTDTTISIDIPSEITEGSTFIASIDVANVINLDSGQFELSYEPGVIELTDLSTGIYKGEFLPEGSQVLASQLDKHTIRVIFNSPGAGPGAGVTGSGSLVKLEFNAIGSAGQYSKLDLSSNADFNDLRDNWAQTISANWLDTLVQIQSTETTVSIEAPNEVLSGTSFTASINIQNVTHLDSGQLELSYDNKVVAPTDPITGVTRGDFLPEGTHIVTKLSNEGNLLMIFNSPGAGPEAGITGSGTLIEIEFNAIGNSGQSSQLNISSHSKTSGLWDNWALAIPTSWQDTAISLSADAHRILASGKMTNNDTPQFVASDEFKPSEWIWVHGKNFSPSQEYKLWIQPYDLNSSNAIEGQTLKPEQSPPGFDPLSDPVIIHTNYNGAFDPIKIWQIPERQELNGTLWQIVADKMGTENEGIYNASEDGLDAVVGETYGFTIYPELPTIVLFALGLTGLAGLYCFNVVKRRRNCSVSKNHPKQAIMKYHKHSIC